MILHSKIIGEGFPFIILHGLFGMGDNWKTLGKRFSDSLYMGEQGYQLHLIDQRNHGRSFHDDEFNYNVLVSDLKEYCDYYKIDKYVVLGHSMGGKTAMQFAVTFPEMISKLIVADISPKAYPLHHQDIIKVLSLLANIKLESRKEADEILSGYIDNIGIRQFLLKNLYWKNNEELTLRMNLPILIEHIDKIGKALKDEMIYRGDTLFIKGAASGYIQKGDEVLIEKHFPKAIIKSIENAGHWLHAENPTEFYNEVINFISL